VDLTARVEALENLVQRLLFNKIGGQGPVFVFRPGGVQSSNVFTSWATMMAGVNATQGPTTIFIDDSIVSPAVVPAGTWNMSNVTVVGAENNANEFATLNFAQNAKITFSFLALNFLEIQSVGSAVVSTISSVSVLVATQTSINISSNTQAFFEVLNGGLLSVTQMGGNFGDNVHNLFKIDAGGVFVYSGSLGADLEGTAVGGAGAAAGAAGTFTSDCIAHAASQGGTWTQASSASNEGYAATTVANWSGTNPSSVANALDRIAAKITPIP
jgi:hypothetical protein